MKIIILSIGILLFYSCVSKKNTPVNETAERNKSDGTSSNGKDNYHENSANKVVNYTSKTEKKRLRKAEKRRNKLNKKSEKEAKNSTATKRKKSIKPPTL